MNASLILPASRFVSRLLATTALSTVLFAVSDKMAQAQVVIGDQPAPMVQDYQQTPVVLPERGDWPYNVKLPRRTPAAADPETLPSRQVSPKLMQAAHLMQSGLTPAQVQEAMAQPAPIMAAPELQGDKPDAPRDDTTTLPPVATGPLMASLADNGIGEAPVAATPAPTGMAANSSMLAPLAVAASDSSGMPSSMAMLGEAPVTPPAPNFASQLDAPKPATGGRALFGGKRTQVADATPMAASPSSATPMPVADRSDHTLAVPDEATPSMQDIAAVPTPPMDAPADTARNSTPSQIAPLTSLSAPPKLLARIGDSSRGAVQRPADRPADTAAAPMPDAAPRYPVAPEPTREPQPVNTPAAVLPAKAGDTAQPALAPMPQPHSGGDDDMPPVPAAAPAAAPVLVVPAKPAEHKTFWNRLFGSSEDHPEAKPAALPPVEPLVEPATPVVNATPEPVAAPMPESAPDPTLGTVVTTPVVVAAQPEPAPVAAPAPEPVAAPAPAPTPVATHKLVAPQSEPAPEPVKTPEPQPVAAPLPQAEVAERPQTVVPSPEPATAPVVAPVAAAKPAAKAQRRTLWGDLFGYDEEKPATVAVAEPAAGAMTTAEEEPYEPIPAAGFAAPAVLSEPGSLSRSKPAPNTTDKAAEAALPKPEDRPVEAAPEPKAAMTAPPLMPEPAAALSDPEPPTRYIEMAEPHAVMPEPMSAVAPVYMPAAAPTYIAPVPVIVAPESVPVVPAFRIEAPTTPNASGLVTPRLVPVAPASAPMRGPAAATTSVPSNNSYGAAPLAQVNFLPSSQSVDSVGQAQLQAIAEAMQMGPQTRLLLNAYAKASNEPESRRISLNRALVVRTKLAELGIQPSRIDVQALGEETPGDIDGGRDRVDAVLH